MIYRLFEYRFRDLEDYSSIELVRTKNYSLQEISELSKIAHIPPLIALLLKNSFGKVSLCSKLFQGVFFFEKIPNCLIHLDSCCIRMLFSVYHVIQLVQGCSEDRATVVSELVEHPDKGFINGILAAPF